MNLDFIVMFFLGYVFNGLITEYFIRYAHTLQDPNGKGVAVLSKDKNENPGDFAYLNYVAKREGLLHTKSCLYTLRTVIVNPISRKVLFTIAVKNQDTNV